MLLLGRRARVSPAGRPSGLAAAHWPAPCRLRWCVRVGRACERARAPLGAGTSARTRAPTGARRAAIFSCRSQFFMRPTRPVSCMTRISGGGGGSADANHYLGALFRSLAWPLTTGRLHAAKAGPTSEERRQRQKVAARTESESARDKSLGARRLLILLPARANKQRGSSNMNTKAQLGPAVAVPN